MKGSGPRAAKLGLLMADLSRGGVARGAVWAIPTVAVAAVAASTAAPTGGVGHVDDDPVAGVGGFGQQQCP